ncbi:zinc-binding alcohol dehydrogenase family protein [Malonomonas rubra DSM 5091]|uniref:Zinc-type alcohol dehydrogenase-like protein n=1 Tax=Malonomonas rubra DSM 5091 TaxID=1122189 RepID=A0A1M6N6E6_MALRU|nr:zinc-binding alcohol dehydrogenase family protein [Malonomonas rubra]SHJ91277.1 zinc-binding alcohol dehydrogenase family protein [Malonomonas rubra DSM 5091]
MKAVGYWQKGLTISDPQALLDLELPEPEMPIGHDLLVRVHAVAVNPRDIKSRMSIESSGGKSMVLGYDASGVVEAVGDQVELFRPGDEVYYAGVLDRQGSNAELQLVDERIVGCKPTTLDHAAAASLPLTSLTAWEMLFDRLQLPQGGAVGETLLVIGGAGGVPSMALQLARQLSRVTVVATASRPESEAWVRSLSAQHVVDHSRPLAAQVAAIPGLAPVTRIFSTHTDTAGWAEMAKIIAPQGRIGLIDDPEPLDLRLMKFKSVSIHWEAMFTRPMFATADVQRQHDILSAVADLVDNGKLRATAATSYGSITAENLRRAHAALEEGHVVGKITLSGFGGSA